METSVNMQELERQLRRAGRALRKAADAVAAGEVPTPSPPLEPPPPPPSRRLLLGGEAHRNGRSDLDVFKEFQEDAGGNANLRVTYSPRLPDTYKDHAAAGDGMVGAAYSWLSVKTFDKGGLTRFMESIPVAKRPYTIVTVWHEPEDNVDTGDFSVAEWTDIQVHLAAVGHELDIATAAVFMAWTWDVRSHRDPQAYADGAFVHPMIGFDGYDDRRVQNEYVGGYSPASVFDAPLESAQQWGIEQWGIRETGTAIQGQQSRDQWWTELWYYALDNGGSVIAPWDSDNRNDWPWCALTRADRKHLGLLASNNA